MPSYLLRGPEESGQTIVGNMHHALVEAPTVDAAKLYAAGEHKGDGGGYWVGSTAILNAAASGWAGWGMRVRVADDEGVLVADKTVTAPAGFTATTITLGDGGEGYEEGDMLSIPGEEGDTPLTASVETVAVGEAATMTITNAGSFTPDLGDKTAVATTNISGTGTGLTLDVTTTGGDPFSISVATVVAGGTGYEVGDTVGISGATGAILTVATVDGAIGEVLTIALVDGGLFAADPTANGIATETDGDGENATLNITAVQGGTAGDIDVLGIEMAQALNTVDEIEGAAFDISTNVLTVAETTDNLGDHRVLVDMIPPGGVAGVDVGVTVTDEGSAGDALEATLPADAYAIPQIIGKLIA